jgi:hypothetical protein
VTSNTTQVRTNSILTVNAIGSDDDIAKFGDTVTFTYVWKKNGVAIEGETGDTLDLGEEGNGSKGEKITVTVTPSTAQLWPTGHIGRSDHPQQRASY